MSDLTCTARGVSGRRPKSSDLIAISLAVWGLIGITLTVFDSLLSWVSTTGLLMASQGFCAMLLHRRYRVVRHAVIPDFLTMFLLFKLIDDTVTLTGVLVEHSRFAVAVSIQNAGLNTSSFVVADTYQAQAGLVFLVATVTVVMVWMMLERHRITALWHEPTAKKTWLAFIVSQLAYLLLPIGAFGQLHSLLKFFALGAMGVLLGGQSRFAFGKRRSFLVFLAAAPILVAAFRSGMKGEVLLVLIPVLLPMLRRLNTHRVLILSLFFVFVLVVIFPFSQTWRDANWVHTPGRQPENIGFVETMQRVVTQWESNGIVNTSISSTAKWLARGSSVQMGGLVMQVADEEPRLGFTLLNGILTIFIPRLFWPDKPSYAPGAWFTWYLGSASSPEAATSATAMTTPAELYWEFGALGVVFGMAIITAVNFFVWVRLLAWGRSSVVAVVALFALLIGSSQLEGAFVIYALSAPIILLIYVAALKFGFRLWSERFSVLSLRNS